MRMEECNKEVTKALDRAFGESVPCKFCGNPLMIEVCLGKKRNGSNGFYMAMFCDCAKWEMVETELEVIHINEMGCRG